MSCKIDRPIKREPVAKAAPVAGVRKRGVEDRCVTPEPVRRRGAVEGHIAANGDVRHVRDRKRGRGQRRAKEVRAGPVRGIVERTARATNPCRSHGSVGIARHGLRKRHALPLLFANGIACNKRTAAGGRDETRTHTVEETRRAV